MTARAARGASTAFLDSVVCAGADLHGYPTGHVRAILAASCARPGARPHDGGGRRGARTEGWGEEGRVEDLRPEEGGKGRGEGVAAFRPPGPGLTPRESRCQPVSESQPRTPRTDSTLDGGLSEPSGRGSAPGRCFDGRPVALPLRVGRLGGQLSPQRFVALHLGDAGDREGEASPPAELAASHSTMRRVSWASVRAQGWSRRTHASRSSLPMRTRSIMFLSSSPAAAPSACGDRLRPRDPRCRTAPGSLRRGRLGACARPRCGRRQRA